MNHEQRIERLEEAAGATDDELIIAVTVVGDSNHPELSEWEPRPDFAGTTPDGRPFRITYQHELRPGGMPGYGLG